MDLPYGPATVTTAVMLGLTLWLLIARLRGRLETSWALFYYVGLATYNSMFPGALDLSWLYLGVLSALVLRFEFMAGWFLKVVRVVDLVVLAHFVRALYGVMFV
jgi:hypothetical protein